MRRKGMKKLKPTLTGLILATFLVLALELSTVPVLADGVAVSIDAPDEVTEGSTFTVDIEIGDVTNLCLVQFDLGYDNTVIGYKAASLGDFWGSVAEDVEVEAVEYTDRVRVTVDYTECNPYTGGGVTGSGTLVELEFDVLGTECQTSELDMSSYSDFNQLWDYRIVKIPAAWADGSVHVTSTATETPASTATPTPNGTPLATDTPTPPDLTGGLLWWHYLLIGLGALVVLLFIVMLFTRRTNR